MNEEQPSAPPDEEGLQGEEPEFFDRALLLQPPEVRQEYFEQYCLIEHPRLLEALEAILEAICAPGEEVLTRRPGTIVLVIGPARVGKTTLIHLLEERLLAYATSRMQADPHFIPFASITAPEPGSGWFDWTDFYKPVLRQLGNPFVDSPTAPIRTRQMREATEAAYLERKPLAIIVDEAHHLAEAARGSRLQRQLPVEEEPLLAKKHWEFLYARSIGCIGLLKLHLNRALNRALKEGSRTITLDHLRQTAASDVRVKLALRNALESEAEFVEADDADAQLLALLRKPLPRPSPKTASGQNGQDQPQFSRNQKPGKRAPWRDSTGLNPGTDSALPLGGEEQVAG